MSQHLAFGSTRADTWRVKPPSARHVELAKQLLACEGGDAVRVYDKLAERLTLLLGARGVQMLFTRSARLTHGAGDAAKVRELVAASDPALSPADATALFATFLNLITTFIGERLTVQVLRSAWPTLEAKAAVEKKNE